MYDFEPGVLARLPSSGRDSASARMARAPRSGLRVDAASCGSLEPGILARLPSSGHGLRLCADDSAVRVQLAHRRAHPERGPRDIRANARACPPSREPGKDALLQHSAGRGVDAQSWNVDTITSARRRECARTGREAGRMPDSIAHRAVIPAGCRRRLAYPASLCEPQDAASTRNPGTWTRSHPREGVSAPGLDGAGQDARLHRPPRRNPGRTPASNGVSGNLVQAAGRGVDAQSWNLDTITSARRRECARTGWSRAGCPTPSSTAP